jgi:hypothetical protein
MVLKLFAAKAPQLDPVAYKGTVWRMSPEERAQETRQLQATLLRTSRNPKEIGVIQQKLGILTEVMLEKSGYDFSAFKDRVKLQDAESRETLLHELKGIRGINPDPLKNVITEAKLAIVQDVICPWNNGGHWHDTKPQTDGPLG